MNIMYNGIMAKAIFRIIIIMLILFQQENNLAGQDINPELLSKKWKAQWITDITCLYAPKNQGIFYFRKSFDVDKQYKKFVIHVSADNRYKLYVNGKYIGNGPAYSDILNWGFDTYDIAKYLKQGKNVIAANVWNYGGDSPWSQLSFRTGFILQGNTPNASIVNTDHTWKVRKGKARQFVTPDKDFFPQTTGVGPMEVFDAKKYNWGWLANELDDSRWQNAKSIGSGKPAALVDNEHFWNLIPRNIPFMEEKVQRFEEIERSEGMPVSKSFLQGKEDIIISAGTRAALLLDQAYVTTAYPEITVSKGENSKIKMIYNEGMYNEQQEKVHRDSTENLKLIGLYDVFMPDGGHRKSYRPLWYRTYRYVKIEIETKSQPLILHDVKGYFTAYPFELKASFVCNDSMLNRIFETGWRTARLCAHEVYVDCPYYEQLQYFGDLNISNPISVLLSGDARLMKKTILQANDSRFGDGLTMCAYPANTSGKIIPFFSLAWIDMIYNYWRFTDDTALVYNMLPGVMDVLNWYEDKLNDNGLLGPVPHWNFVDCTDQWPWAPENGSICEPPGAGSGNSAILSLQYVYGLQRGKDLLQHAGLIKEAAHCNELIERITKATYDLCWDKSNEYIADTPEKNSFSQHANIFAVLSGMFGNDYAREMLPRIIKDTTLIQSSMQFRAYFHKALVNAEMEEEYLSYLKPWKKMIEWGFTTFPEYPDLNARSDCHAWNAFPAYELLTIVCGIRPEGMGFNKVVIEPHLGDLKWVKGTMPHRSGAIHVDLKVQDKKLEGTVNLPEGLTGTFVYGTNEMELVPGEQTIEMSLAKEVLKEKKKKR